MHVEQTVGQGSPQPFQAATAICDFPEVFDACGCQRPRNRHVDDIRAVRESYGFAANSRVSSERASIALNDSLKGLGLALTSTRTPLPVRASPDLRSVRQGDTCIGGAHRSWKRPVSRSRDPRNLHTTSPLG